MCKAVKKSQSEAGRRSLRLGVAEPVLNELRRPQRECPGCGEYDAQVRLVHHQGRQRTEGDIFTLDWDGSTTSTRGGVDSQPTTCSCLRESGTLSVFLKSLKSHQKRKTFMACANGVKIKCPWLVLLLEPSICDL